MAKYRNEKNIKIKQDEVYNIPHGGNDAESSSTVTRVEFKKGDSLSFIKQQLKQVLSSLGLNKQQASQYLKKAFKELYS